MASMAALRPKLLSILPLLFVINGVNAQLFHFPHLPFLNHPFLSGIRGNGASAAALAEGLDPRTGMAGIHVDPLAGKNEGRFAGSAGTVTNSRTAGIDVAKAAGDNVANVGDMIEFDPNAQNAAIIPNPEPFKGRGGRKGKKPVVPVVLPDVGSKPDPEPKPMPDAPPQPDFPTKFAGAWEVVQLDSGVSAMHLNLMPNNKIMMYDASAFHISNIKLPNGECLPFKDDKGVDQTDCWSHAVEYDVVTNKVRPLKVLTDPWCSSGGLTADGNFISTGGWMGGDRSVRYFDACDTCDFRYDVAMVLAEPRWYATQVTLPDGRFFLVGGRKSYSFEYVPPEGQVNKKAIFFPLLDETTDLDENNLYPFVHVSTDGNLWILANSRSILLDPKTNKVIKEFPVLQGGSRNYPASGMSALLPIDLSIANPALVPAEVIVCGGAKPEAYGLAGKGNFINALQDCARLRITDPNPVWATELMPSPRVMGDMLILPTGDLLLLNGAHQGASAWFLAEQPNFTPVLYSPNNKPGARFRNLNPTQIARMYHSSSAVLPNGKILVAGSNTNPGYDYKAKYPTELRVEHFAPPYLDPALAVHRPEIVVAESDGKLKYGRPFNVQFQLAEKATKSDFKVTMYAPPFTTHGYSMNQRLLVLAKNELVEAGPGVYRLQVAAPRSNVLAPPGYYLVFVVYRGVPSVGMWVQILN